MNALFCKASVAVYPVPPIPNKALFALFANKKSATAFTPVDALVIDQAVAAFCVLSAAIVPAPSDVPPLSVTPPSFSMCARSASADTVDPFGVVLKEASRTDEEIVIVTCDRRHQETVRRHWPFLRDRRIDAYGDITRRYIDG